MTGAAKHLGLHESQPYAWRKKARYEASRSKTEKELAVENARMRRQLAKKEEELAILKKAAAYFAKSLKYAFMVNNTGDFSISAHCGAFGVSRGGYYAWRHRQNHPSRRQLGGRGLCRP